MLHESTHLQLDLNADEAVALRPAKNSVVHCKRGIVWVTEENGDRDVVLRTGQSYRLTRPGRTVIQPLGLSAGAQCLVQAVQLAHPPHGLLAAVRRWISAFTAGRPGPRPAR